MFQLEYLLVLSGLVALYSFSLNCPLFASFSKYIHLLHAFFLSAGAICLNYAVFN